MKSFIQFLSEGVTDLAQAKKKSINLRTKQDQLAIDNAKANKPKSGKVVVHIQHEDGKLTKETFKLKSKDWESEAAMISQDHLKNLQRLKDQFPALGPARAKSVHKIEIK